METITLANINKNFVGSINELKTTLDEKIVNNIEFELIDFPICHFRAYKKYIVQKSEHDKSNCNNCIHIKNCSGIEFPEYAKPINKQAIMSDNEKCMLKILNSENNIITSRVLELAPKFKICADCSAGSQVISSGEKLIKRNLVTKTFTKNGYIWKLVK